MKMDFNRENDPYHHRGQSGTPWEMTMSQYLPTWSTATEPLDRGELPLSTPSWHDYNLESGPSFHQLTSETTSQPTGGQAQFGGMLPIQGSSSQDYEGATGPLPPGLGPPPGLTPSQTNQFQSTLDLVPYHGPGYLAPPEGLPIYSVPPQDLDLNPDLMHLGFVNILVPVYPGSEQLPISAFPFGGNPSLEPQSDPAIPSYFRYRSTGGWPQGQGAKPRGKYNKGGWAQPKWNPREGHLVPGGGMGHRRKEQDPSNLEYCRLCMNNGEPLYICYNHTLHDKRGNVTCPDLRAHVCRFCGATGDKAHTLKFCPVRRGQGEGLCG